MAQVQVAREFFQAHLPADIQQHLDFSTLKIEKDTFVDDAFKASEADLLYSVTLQNKSIAYLYLLCEHLSSIDKNVAFRLLVYLIDIMKQHRAQHPNDPLPVVMPLVLYTGETPWSAPLDIFPLFGEQEALARRLWPPAYQLIDVHRITDDTMKQQEFSGLMEFILKHAKARDIETFLSTAFPWLTTAAKKNLQEALLLAKNVVFYVSDINEALDKPTLNRLANQHLNTPLRSELMTLTEQLRQEGKQEGLQIGIQQGMQQGMQQGEATLLKRQLARRFGHLDAYYAQQINQASPEQLLIWSDRIFDAQSLTDIFGNQAL